MLFVDNTYEARETDKSRKIPSYTIYDLWLLYAVYANYVLCAMCISVALTKTSVEQKKMESDDEDNGTHFK